MTIDKIKLRELATLIVSGEYGNPHGEAAEMEMRDLCRVLGAGLLALLDELDAVTKEHDDLTSSRDFWRDRAVRSANDALCCAHERDELKRLSKAYLDTSDFKGVEFFEAQAALRKAVES